MWKKYFIFFGLICALFIGVDMVTSIHHVTDIRETVEKRKFEFLGLYDYMVLLFNLKEADISVNKYLVTGDSKYLELYEDAVKYFHSDQFRQNFEIELEHQDSKAIQIGTDLQQSIEKKLEIMAESVAIMKRQGSSAALRYISDLSNREVSRQTQNFMSEVLLEKLNLLDIGRDEIEKMTKKTLFQFMVSDIIEALILFLSLFLLYRSFRQLSKREEELSIARGELIESLAVQKTVFNSIPCAIISFNKDGVITEFNDAAEKLLGYSREEVVEKKTPLVFHDDQALKERSFEIFKRIHEKVEGVDILTTLARKKGNETGEWSFRRKDGQSFPAFCSTSSLYDNQGNLIGYVKIIQDLTDIKEMDKLKDELFAIAGFELREPVAAIKGVFDFMSFKENRSGEKIDKVLEIGKRNCERLIHLESDIIGMLKMEKDRSILSLTATDLATFLSIVAQNEIPKAAEAHVEFIYTPPPNFIMVEIDHILLTRLMGDLLSDAIKRTVHGGVVQLATEERGANVRIIIKDQNPREHSQETSRILKSFLLGESLGDASMMSNYLSLKLARLLIEKHNGTIGFDINQQEESLWIELPIFQSSSSPK